jgi:hypothetical protein
MIQQELRHIGDNDDTAKKIIISWRYSYCYYIVHEDNGAQC